MKKKKPPADPSPWNRGTDVKGVVPPGRRLDPDQGDRRAAWQASGVRGVTPPGRQKPGDGPGIDFMHPRKQRSRPRAGPGTPQHGAAAKATGSAPSPMHTGDEKGRLHAGMKPIAAHFRAHPPSASVTADVAAWIRQSQAPYELAVGFAILSVATENDPALRRTHDAALRRGSAAFFRLSQLIDPKTRLPRGTNIALVESIFESLPVGADAMPFAYTVGALLRALPILQPETLNDQGALLDLAETLWRKHVLGQRVGDLVLEDRFPLTLPDWPGARFES